MGRGRSERPFEPDDHELDAVKALYNKLGIPYEGKGKGKGKGDKASLQIRPNQIMLPFVPKEAETDEQYGDGVEGIEDKQVSNRQPLMISDGKYFNEYGEPIQNPAFGIDPAGNPVNLPHMEQTPEERIRNEELHKLKYHSNKKLGSNWSKRLLAGATSRQIRDRLKSFTKGKGYDDAGGSLRGIPDSLRIQLLRDAKA